MYLNAEMSEREVFTISILDTVFHLIYVLSLSSLFPYLSLGLVVSFSLSLYFSLLSRKTILLTY